jgi:hypothetical protein
VAAWFVPPCGLAHGAYVAAQLCSSNHATQLSTIAFTVECPTPG